MKVMNNQTKLTNYFKKKGGILIAMEGAKKHKLSLNRKSQLPMRGHNESTENIIDLCSDNEESIFSEVEDKTSDTTIPYNVDTITSPVTPQKSPRTPSKTPNSRTPGTIFSEVEDKTSDTTIPYNVDTITSPVTPQKSPRTPSKTPNRKTPGTKRKYYSPTKNRRIASPSKAKKSINKCLFSNTKDILLDTFFYDYCAGFDDKTIFLLKIIYEYLKDDSLRCLLPEDASILLSKCFDVMKPGMCLVCRLYWRQRGWYRISELKKIVDKKKETGDHNLNIILHSLVQIGCLVSSESGNQVILTFEDYCDILKLEDFKLIAKEFKIKGHNKQEIILALKNFMSAANNITTYFVGPKSNNGSRLMQRLKMVAGSCYRLTEEADLIFTKLHYLMYLGMDKSIMREKKLELLLINDKANIETYPIGDEMPLDNASIIFSNSAEFERYFNACQLFERWETAQSLERLDILEQVFCKYKDIDEETMMCYKSLPPWLRRFTPAYIYIRILESGIQELKRIKKDGFPRAVEILENLLLQRAFRQHKRGEWYLEKALILHNHMNCQEEAAELLLNAFKSDLSDDVKQALIPRATKVATMKSNGIAQHLRQQLLKHVAVYGIQESDFDAYHIYQMPMENYNNRGKIKFETRSPTGERTILEAEQFCIMHYINKGDFTHGGHWEGRMVTTVFFLLFWDIIYMRLPGVRGIFLTKHYMYPQDLFTDSFYLNRKTLIDEKLALIEGLQNDQLIIMMKETWESRPEYERSGIDRSIGWQSVEQVCHCLGGKGLAALCRRLALDYRYTHSGFPDLTLWNTGTKQIMFVEVKTDSDSPSTKQLQWLHYLRESGLRGQMCYVGVDTTRQRARGSHVQTSDS